MYACAAPMQPILSPALQARSYIRVPLARSTFTPMPLSYMPPMTVQPTAAPARHALAAISSAFGPSVGTPRPLAVLMANMAHSSSSDSAQPRRNDSAMSAS